MLRFSTSPGLRALLPIIRSLNEHAVNFYNSYYRGTPTSILSFSKIQQRRHHYHRRQQCPQKSLFTPSTTTRWSASLPFQLAFAHMSCSSRYLCTLTLAFATPSRPHPPTPPSPFDPSLQREAASGDIPSVLYTWHSLHNSMLAASRPNGVLRIDVTWRGGSLNQAVMRALHAQS